MSNSKQTLSPIQTDTKIAAIKSNIDKTRKNQDSVKREDEKVGYGHNFSPQKLSVLILLIN